jgi:hypothetical protein
MSRLLTYSLLFFYLGFSLAGYNINTTTSYFTDIETSGANTITAGHWQVDEIEKDDCKKGGWEELVDPDTGEIFKNQGQCVSHTNHENNNLEVGVAEVEEAEIIQPIIEEVDTLETSTEITAPVI